MREPYILEADAYHAKALQSFSKVSPLRNVPYKLTVELQFENFGLTVEKELPQVDALRARAAARDAETLHNELKSPTFDQKSPAEYPKSPAFEEIAFTLHQKSLALPHDELGKARVREEALRAALCVERENIVAMRDELLSSKALLAHLQAARHRGPLVAFFVGECRAHLIEYRALLIKYRALLIECSALSIEYWTLLIEYGALFIEYGALLIETQGSCGRTCS